MPELKSIVLVLGNGFDLDLGLKTSYKDFWESDNCPKDYPAPLINHLNQRWPNNLDAVRWYDLENELYYYVKNISSGKSHRDVITEKERAFLEIVKPELISYGIYYEYNDQINSLLLKGILIEDTHQPQLYRIPHLKDLMKTPLERDAKALDLIKKGLGVYLKQVGFPNNNKKTVAFRVLKSVLNAVRAGNLAEIFSFNYTWLWLRDQTVDEIEVYNMHGKCNEENVIIGTRDDTSLKEDYAFVQKSFDPTFYPPHLVGSLHSADEVIIFGHSIGENDRQYFKAFFKEQSNYSHIVSKKITIFTKDHLSEIQVKLALQNMTDGNLSTLFGQNTMRIIKTNELREDLENRKMFKEFLLDHNTEERSAEEIIGDLLSRE